MFKFKRHRGHRFARGEFWGGGHDGGHPHMRPHMRGGRRARMFDQGDLRLVLLKLIEDTPRHGYELIKLIEEKLGGAYSPSPGVIYPTLTLLEEMGYATVQASDGAKKLYAITADGKAFLDENRQAVDGIGERMEKIAESQSGPTPQIVRATENLRTALRLRLARGNLSVEDAQKIADALDAAAKSVEQS